MRLIERVATAWLRPQISVFSRFHRPPYGGANQFLMTLRRELLRRGFRVAVNLLGPETRGALLNAFDFDEPRLRRMRSERCRLVHRVDGPVGRYRGQDDTIDRRIAGLNQEFAAATVFQSQYSLRAHEEMGLRFASPVVIPNAADPVIFHPPTQRCEPAGKVRLVSTSWSDNPNKGAATYAWLDRHLDWSRFEYTFVGRIGTRFDRIRVLPPLGPRALANELRCHHVYVTASLHDPCSNALIEGLACGLPALAVRSGGHPELVGEGGVLFESTDDVLDALDALVRDRAARAEAIRVPCLEEVADRYLDVLGLPRRTTVS